MATEWTEQALEVAPAVLEVLQGWRGSSYVMSRQTLCHRLGCSDRVLRAAIVELRKQGHLIIADEDGGYRFARSVDEVLGYTGSLKSRIGSLWEVIRLMEAAAERQFGPQQLGLL